MHCLFFASAQCHPVSHPQEMLARSFFLIRFFLITRSALLGEMSSKTLFDRRHRRLGRG